MQLTRTLTLVLLGLATSAIASPIVIKPEPEQPASTGSGDVIRPSPLADILKEPPPPNFKGPRDAEFHGRCGIEAREASVHCFPMGEIF